MRSRLFISLILLLTSQLIFAQSETDFPNVYTFENGTEIHYPDGWEVEEIKDGITALQKQETDLIFATSPFIVTDEFVSLEEVLVGAINIADTPVPPTSDAYTYVDTGERASLAYSYKRDDVMGGLIVVIRLSDGTLGTLDIVLPMTDFADQQAEITNMLNQFDRPMEEDEVIRLTFEEEVALNANWQGMQNLTDGKFNQALKNFTTAIENNPTNAIFYENRGHTHTSLGKSEPAIEDYTKAIELDPEIAWTYFYRAYNYETLEEYELAIADQTEAIRLNPTEALYYTDRGATKRRLGDFEGAIEDYTQAIELEPYNTDAYFVRAMAYAFAEDFDNAIADYEKVMELEPDNTSVIHLMQHYVDGDIELAIQGYSNHISREPNFAPLYFHRGNAYRELGDTENALADLNTYLELAGEDADPRASEWIAELEG